ncbi:uncharacterized protein LOC120347018 [Styela clava]
MEKSKLSVEDKTDQSSQMSTLDLYEDLLINENRDGEEGNRILTMKEVLSEKHSLEEQNKLLLQNLVEEKQKSDKLKEEKLNVEQNLKSLLATAKVELARKNRLLNHYIGGRESQTMSKNQPKSIAPRANDTAKQKRLLALYKGRRADDPELTNAQTSSHGLLQHRGEKMVGVATKVIGSSFENSTVTSKSMLSAQYHMSFNNRMNQASNRMNSTFLTETGLVHEGRSSSAITSSDQKQTTKDKPQNSNISMTRNLSPEQVQKSRRTPIRNSSNQEHSVKDQTKSHTVGTSGKLSPKQVQEGQRSSTKNSSHQEHSVKDYKQSPTVPTSKTLSSRRGKKDDRSRATSSRSRKQTTKDQMLSHQKHSVKDSKRSPTVHNSKTLSPRQVKNDPSAISLSKKQTANDRMLISNAKTSKNSSPGLDSILSKLTDRLYRENPAIDIRDLDASDNNDGVSFKQKNIGLTADRAQSSYEKYSMDLYNIPQTTNSDIKSTTDVAKSSAIAKNPRTNTISLNKNGNETKSSDHAPKKLNSVLKNTEDSERDDVNKLSKEQTSTSQLSKSKKKNSDCTIVKISKTSPRKKLVKKRSSDAGSDSPDKLSEKDCTNINISDVSSKLSSTECTKKSVEAIQSSAAETKSIIDVNGTMSETSSIEDTKKLADAIPSITSKKKSEIDENDNEAEISPEPLNSSHKVQLSIEVHHYQPLNKCNEKYTEFQTNDENSICKNDDSSISLDKHSGDLKDNNADLVSASARTMGNYKRLSRMNKSHPLNLQLGSTKQNDKSFKKRKARWICTDIIIEQKDSSINVNLGKEAISQKTSDGGPDAHMAKVTVPKSIHTGKNYLNQSKQGCEFESKKKDSKKNISKALDTKDCNSTKIADLSKKLEVKKSKQNVKKERTPVRRSPRKPGKKLEENSEQKKTKVSGKKLQHDATTNKEKAFLGKGSLNHQSEFGQSESSKEYDIDLNKKLPVSKLPVENCISQEAKSRNGQNIQDIPEESIDKNAFLQPNIILPGDKNTKTHLPSSEDPAKGNSCEGIQNESICNDDFDPQLELDYDESSLMHQVLVQPDEDNQKSTSVSLKNDRNIQENESLNPKGVPLANNDPQTIMKPLFDEMNITASELCKINNLDKDPKSKETLVDGKTQLDCVNIKDSKITSDLQPRVQLIDIGKIASSYSKRRIGVDVDGETPRKRRKSAEDRSKIRDFNLLCSGKKINKNVGVSNSKKSKLKTKKSRARIISSTSTSENDFELDHFAEMNEIGIFQDDVFLNENIASSSHIKSMSSQSSKIENNDETLSHIKSDASIQLQQTSQTPTKVLLETDNSNSPAFRTRSRKKNAESGHGIINEDNKNSSLNMRQSVEKQINAVKTKLQFGCYEGTSQQCKDNVKTDVKTTAMEMSNIETQSNVRKISDNVISEQVDNINTTFPSISKSPIVVDRTSEDLISLSKIDDASSRASKSKQDVGSSTPVTTNMIDVAMEVVVKTSPEKVKHKKRSKNSKDKKITSSKKKQKRTEKREKLKVKLKQKKRKSKGKSFSDLSVDSNGNLCSKSDISHELSLLDLADTNSISSSFDSIIPSPELNRWLASAKKDTKKNKRSKSKKSDKKKNKQKTGVEFTNVQTNDGDNASHSNCSSGFSQPRPKSSLINTELKLSKPDVAPKASIPATNEGKLQNDRFNNLFSSVRKQGLEDQKQNQENKLPQETKCLIAETQNSSQSFGFSTSNLSLKNGQSGSVVKTFTHLTENKAGTSFTPSMFPETSQKIINPMRCYKNAALQWLIHIARSKLSDIEMPQPLDLSIKKVNKSFNRTAISKENNPTAVTNLFSSKPVCNLNNGETCSNNVSSLDECLNNDHQSSFTEPHVLKDKSSSRSFCTSKREHSVKHSKPDKEKCEITEKQAILDKDIPEILLHEDTDSVFEKVSDFSKQPSYGHVNKTQSTSLNTSKVSNTKINIGKSNDIGSSRKSTKVISDSRTSHHSGNLLKHTEHHVQNGTDEGLNTHNESQLKPRERSYSRRSNKHSNSVSKSGNMIHDSDHKYIHSKYRSTDERSSYSKYKDERHRSPLGRRRECRSTSRHDRENRSDRCESRSRSHRERSRTKSSEMCQSGYRNYKSSSSREDYRRRSREDNHYREKSHYSERSYRRCDDRDRRSPKRRRIDEKACDWISVDHREHERKQDLRNQSPNIIDWNMLLQEHVKQQQKSDNKKEPESKIASPAKKKKPRRVALERVEMPESEKPVNEENNDKLVSPLSRYLWMNSLKSCQERRKKRARWSSEVSELETSADDTANQGLTSEDNIMSTGAASGQKQVAEVTLNKSQHHADSGTNCNKTSKFSHKPKPTSRKMTNQALATGSEVQADSEDLSVTIPDMSTSSWQLSEESRCRFYSFAKVIQVLSPLKSSPEKLSFSEKNASRKRKKIRRKVLQSP